MVNRSRRRIAGIAAASWVLATAVTSLVVWRAVAVFDDGPSTNVLSAPQVSARLEAAKATSTVRPTNLPSETATDAPTPLSATPSVTSDDTSTPPTSPAATATTSATQTTTRPATSTPTASATPVVKTWTVTGGAVSVSCQGQVITLIYAAPQDGWRVETEKSGPDRIEVDFQRVGQGTELKAGCVTGVPQQTTESNDGDDH